MEFSIKTAIGTISLILINILLFIAFGQSSTSADFIPVFDCVSQNFHECIVIDPDTKAVFDCYQQYPNNKDFCTYSIKSSCMNDPAVQNACMPKSLNTYQKFLFVPAEFTRGKNTPSLLTSMFMHVNWAHLLGNMFCLFIAGIFVERRLGTQKFLIFYILVGLCASLFFYAFNMNSMTGLLGASGAISGIMGANLILAYFKPSADDQRTRSTFRPVNLIVFIFYQFVFSVVGAGDHIAYLGHIGGFLAGVILISMFKKKDDVYMAEEVA